MKKMKSDTTIKIFALLISLVLWAFVMKDTNPVIKRDYRNTVEITNQEDLEKKGLRIMDVTEEMVNITISGKKSDWAKFSADSDINAYVDLSGYSEGNVKVPVKVELKQLSSMQIVDYQPREILFNFDKIVNVDKMVTIETEGELAEGYVKGDIELKSPYISLKGPRSWVNQVSKIIANINIEGRKEDINITVPVKILDDERNTVVGVTHEPSVIEVKIPVYKTNTLPIEVQTINELPENFQATDINIEPKFVSIVGKEAVSNLKFIQTKPIDINEFIENDTINVELELPRGVSLQDPSQKIAVSINVEEIVAKTFEYDFEQVEIRDLNEELEIDLEEGFEKIKIIVKASKEIMDGVTEEDIEIYLDLNMIEAGEHTIFIGFNAPSGVTIKTIEPQPMAIKIINKGESDE